MDNTVSENESHRQLGFIATLPSDIVLEIFSHLNQQDCLTSMAVCRDWYAAIPEYTRSIWKDLVFSERVARDHRRRELCLGSHVKNITIEPSEPGPVVEQELRTLIHKLLDWGCTQVESIDLYSCNTPHLDDCLDLLKLIAPHLTRLKLHQHGSKLDILHILYAFPDLTYLWCHTFYSNDYGRDAIIRPFDILDDYHSNVTQLRLDIMLTKAQKESILRKCPNLRSLVDTCKSIVNTDSKVNLDDLFAWCPRISFLQTTFYVAEEDPDYYIGDDKEGLHFLSIHDCYDVDQIGRHLTRNQDTLEYLRIRQDELSNDYSRVLGELHLQNLKSLTFSSICINADNLVALLNHCPVLEKLHLHSSRCLTVTSAAFQSIHPMQQLKSMEFHGIILEDGLSLLTVLGHFPLLEALTLNRMTLQLELPVCPESPSHLKRLELPYALWHVDSGVRQDTESAVANFLRYLTSNSKVEIIRLPNVSMMGRRSLLTIAMIPTLRTLEVDLDRTVQEEELLEFIRMLRETAIVSLILGNLYSLSFAVCVALTELLQLETFATNQFSFGGPITHINGDGLQHLLRKSPRLVQLKFYNNSEVENNGKKITTRDQLSALINEQVSQVDESYGVPPGHWDLAPDTHNSTQLHSIAIKRI
ncbi:hypothetical protein BJV82DRAFT_675196 [Fennellomyces sp. T-0311]|nr:hypothetical protein BJV82DRAFT_675196 [Fennellomyces sp. T-0311]